MRKRIYVSHHITNPRLDLEARRLGLEKLAEIGNVEDQPSELTDREAEGVIAVIADSAPFRDSFYEAAVDLRVVARWGVGFDKVNVEAATKHGVLVTVTPVHMDTVAEYTIAQWLATLKRVYTLNRNSHEGNFEIIPTYEAQGSTLGLYGFGRIGQEVAKRARPLLGESGRLLVYDIRPDIEEVSAPFGAEIVDRPEVLFEEATTVSLHVSGDETIVTRDQLRLMKPHASLINPSRGNLVDDNDVNQAIRDECLCYYVVDDPVNGPRAIHKGHPRIICTNHNGGITLESTERLDAKSFEQVTDAILGRRPQHILNEEVLDHPRVKSWLRNT